MNENKEMSIRSQPSQRMESVRSAYQVHVFDHHRKFPAVVARGEDLCGDPEFFGFENDFSALPFDPSGSLAERLSFLKSKGKVSYLHGQNGADLWGRGA